jgi:hypothetical protein
MWVWSTLQLWLKMGTPSNSAPKIDRHGYGTALYLYW